MELFNEAEQTLPDMNEVEQFIEDIGYGTNQINALTLGLLCIMISSLSACAGVSLILPLMQYFQVSSLNLSILSTSFFIVSAIGSISTTFMLTILSRRQLFSISILIFLSSSFILSIISNYGVFFIFRLISAFFLGLFLPISFTSMSEYMPLKYQDYIKNLIWSGSSIIIIIAQIIMMTIMPNYEFNESFTVLLVFFAAFFILILFGIFLYKESPCYLIVKGKNKKAILMYQQMAAEQGIDLSKDLQKKIEAYLINKMEALTPLPIYDSFRVIFTYPYLWNSVIAFSLLFFSIMCMGGWGFTSILIANSLGKSGNSILWSSLITNISCFVFQVIFGLILVKIKPKYYSILLALLCTVAAIIFVILPEGILYINVIYMTAITLLCNSIASLIPQLYPPKIFVSAQANVFALLNIGTGLSQIIFYSLYSLNTGGPGYFMIAVNFMTIVLLFFLKVKVDR